MPAARHPYPVVDLFAGPGGLGEGFASVRGKSYATRFESVVAIERDEASHQTLLLRHFLRRFPYEQLPDDYYRYLRRDIDRDELYRNHKAEYQDAKKSALKISLGPESHAEVKRLISRKLGGERRWALVGGPPCQAYSLVGRARMVYDPEFAEDERHTLYLEYLKIIIDHQPPVFVMENVKGLLSAQIDGKPAITRIVRDLTNPRKAVRDGSNGLAYRLYSLSEEDIADEEVDPALFLVKAEEYGVPQARHRMFIVGIREDIKVRPRLLRSHKAPTVRQTIGGLPPIRSIISRGADSVENWREEIGRIADMDIRRQLNGAVYAGAVAKGITLPSIQRLNSPRATASNKYLRSATGRHETLKRLHDPRLNVLTGHEARKHMASDLRRYMFAAVFAQVTGRTPKLKDFPVALLPDHQNVELARQGQMFNDRFRVQLPDQVATTITSHISKDGHYFSERIVRQIDDCEDYIPSSHKNGDTVPELPPSLYGALNEFIIARTIRNLRGQTGKHCSMLINVSRFVATQRQVRDFISERQNRIMLAVKANYAKAVPKTETDEHMRGLKATFETEFGECGCTWPEVRKALFGTFEHMRIYVVNSKSDEVLDYRKYEKEGVGLCLKLLAEQLDLINRHALETDRMILASARATEVGRRLMAVPGVGPVLASAIVASVPDPHAFKSGRNLAAWIGLVPRQNSSGGKERLGGITKQGNRYLRQLLVVGALAVIRYAERHGSRRPWLVQLMARRTTKIAAVALANKNARMIWAIMTGGEAYREPVLKAA